MQKVWKVILVLSLVANLVLGYLLIGNPKTSSLDTGTYVDKIDSLESEIVILQQAKDSVRDSIRTTIIYIRDNQNKYEETRDSIINNSVWDDYLFFTNYLEQNRQRLYDMDNSKSVKGD